MITAPVVWIIAGLVLLVAEFFIPVLIYVFFGVAAIATGLLVFAGHLDGIGVQVGLFAGLSLILTFSLRRLAKRIFKGFTADVANTEPGFEDFVGRDAVVITVGKQVGKMRVSFRGCEWDAYSARILTAGDTVRIVGRNGSRLLVEKIST